MFIDVNIIGFNKIYRYAWRNGFLTFVLVVCYYSISFFIAFFLFLFFNLTFYLISSSYDQKSSIFKFFYHLYTRYIIIIQNHQRFEYYTFQKIIYENSIYAQNINLKTNSPTFRTKCQCHRRKERCWSIIHCGS